MFLPKWDPEAPLIATLFFYPQSIQQYLISLTPTPKHFSPIASYVIYLSQSVIYFTMSFPTALCLYSFTGGSNRCIIFCQSADTSSC